MQQLKVIYSPTKCIGNGACARESPERFVLKGKKAQLKGSTRAGEDLVLEGSFDELQAQQLIAAAKNCPVNAIRVVDQNSQKDIVATKLSEASDTVLIHAQYDDLKEFVLDPVGYFLIRILPATKEIEVALCGEKNIIVKKVIGKIPLEIYQTCIKNNLLSRHDHAAYLGRELQKAFIALQQGLPYVQDDELVFS